MVEMNIDFFNENNNTKLNNEEICGLLEVVKRGRDAESKMEGCDEYFVNLLYEITYDKGLAAAKQIVNNYKDIIYGFVKENATTDYPYNTLLANSVSYLVYDIMEFGYMVGSANLEGFVKECLKLNKELYVSKTRLYEIFNELSE